MNIDEFVLHYKKDLDDTNANKKPTESNCILSVPYQDCKQFKTKDLIETGKKYGLIISKAIHFPTSDEYLKNQYKRQGGIVIYYKGDEELFL